MLSGNGQNNISQIIHQHKTIVEVGVELTSTPPLGLRGLFQGETDLYLILLWKEYSELSCFWRLSFLRYYVVSLVIPHVSHKPRAFIIKG
jgi:hypothetical protein